MCRFWGLYGFTDARRMCQVLGIWVSLWLIVSSFGHTSYAKLERYDGAVDISRRRILTKIFDDPGRHATRSIRSGSYDCKDWHASFNFSGRNVSRWNLAIRTGPGTFWCSTSFINTEIITYSNRLSNLSSWSWTSSRGPVPYNVFRCFRQYQSSDYGNRTPRHEKST
jgi:hypothetical protein